MLGTRVCAWPAVSRQRISNKPEKTWAACAADAAALSESLAAGAIESVAENTTDSVVAPVFYFVLFGLPGALAYRAVNTLMLCTATGTGTNGLAIHCARR